MHGILLAGMSVLFRLTAFLGLGSVWLAASSNVARSEPLVTVPGLTLSVAPIVDVGSYATFSFSARSWPGPATAALRFVSPNHGFTGSMLWDVRCRCFRVAVFVAKQLHALETAHAFATARFASGTASAAATFQIRGLAPGGHTYASGGNPILRGWVSDPNPRRGQNQRYCAWVHASDAFGIAGVPVRFVVRYHGKPQTLTPGKTDTNGVACAARTIDGAAAGVAVAVDVYAGSLHARAHFTPRS